MADNTENFARSLKERDIVMIIDCSDAEPVWVIAIVMRCGMVDRDYHNIHGYYVYCVGSDHVIYNFTEDYINSLRCEILGVFPEELWTKDVYEKWRVEHDLHQERVEEDAIAGKVFRDTDFEYTGEHRVPIVGEYYETYNSLPYILMLSENGEVNKRVNDGNRNILRPITKK